MHSLHIAYLNPGHRETGFSRSRQFEVNPATTPPPRMLADAFIKALRFVLAITFLYLTLAGQTKTATTKKLADIIPLIRDLPAFLYCRF
jgi:hypothetical protein